MGGTGGAGGPWDVRGVVRQHIGSVNKLHWRRDLVTNRPGNFRGVAAMRLHIGLGQGEALLDPAGREGPCDGHFGG